MDIIKSINTYTYEKHIGKDNIFVRLIEDIILIIHSHE